MSDDAFGEDPFTSGNNNTTFRPASPELSRKVALLEERRRQFLVVAESLFSIWKNFYQTPPYLVDAGIQALYEEYLKLAPHLGVSLQGLPQLRECCGIKRSIPPELLQDPSKTLLGTAALPAPPAEKLAWWPGDIIRRITRLFGAKYCEKCDQRRRWINSWFGKKY